MLRDRAAAGAAIALCACALSLSCSDQSPTPETEASTESSENFATADDVVEVLGSDSAFAEPQLQRGTSRITRSFGLPLPLAPKEARSDDVETERGPSNRERLLATAREASADEPIRVSILLPEVKTSWRAMQDGPTTARREHLIKLREDQLRNSQSRAIDYLTRIKAKDIVSHWIANSIEATIEARHVPDLVGQPDFEDVGAPVPVAPLAWDGRWVQDALRTTSAHALGIDAHRGSKLGNGRIKIGIVEGALDAGRKWPPRAHAGWKRSDDPGRSRIVTSKLCRATGCTDHPTGNSVAGGHGALVAEVAAGSIEAGQDPTFPGVKTSAQRQRSGQAIEAYIRYYLISTGASIVTAIESAIRDGVDILNLSWEVPNTRCDATANADGSLNAALVNATNSGTIIVASAGNELNTGACNISYPALRTEALAIGQLNSTNDHPLASYTTLPVSAKSSRGGVPIKTFDGVPSSIAGVGLIVPGCYSFGYNMTGSMSNYGIEACGTSFAAPAVSGLLGIMRHAWWQAGFAKNDARMMMTNALLLGDGWNGATIQQKGLHPVTGAGRPRLHWPSNSDLVAPWGWGQRVITIHQGETITWPVGNGGPMSPSVTLWKWATLYTWTDPAGGAGGLSNVPDIDFYVDDTCNGTTITIDHDTSRDTRARFRLTKERISGKCLRMRAYGHSIPPGGATFYSADYFHSGDPSLH